MKTIGLVISHKNNERRRALLPEDVGRLKYPGQLCFETGYGLAVGCKDLEYRELGAKIVTREEALACDIITDVKLGDADFLDEIEDGRGLFGWAHAVQKSAFTSAVIKGGHTVYAWENLYENGRYIFYRNREIAGEAAIMQAYLYCGRMPYDTRVAIIGNGQTAKGALRILHGLGAKVEVFPRKMFETFKSSISEFDIIVNCVLWDTSRTDRLIYRSDLSLMKPGAMIVDVSCDPELEIETSHPTTIDDPVYVVDGIIHYAVDNTPAMFPVSVTKLVSKGIYRYFDILAAGEDDPALKESIVIDKGIIIDPNITEYREKNGIGDM